MLSIRKKAAIIMSGCLLLVLILGYVATQFVLMPSYLALEDQMARESLTRVLNALQDEVDNLDKYVSIYAWSDDASNFIRTLNHDYIVSNLQDTNFMQIRVNAAVFTNAQDQVVYSTEYQPEYGEEIPLPSEFNASLLSVSIQSYAISLGARMNESLQARMSGLVILPEGPMLISIRHILPSNRTGPVHGNLMMGRYLDSLEITRLEQITHVSLTLHRPDDPAIPSSLFTLGKGSDGESILTVPADSKTTDAYTIIDDVSGHPIIVLQAEMPRDIYNAGVTTVEYIMASLLLAGMLFGCVSMAISEKAIFSRMAKLERDVAQIGAQGKFSSRLTVAGGDEVTRLSTSINKMLASLDESQKRFQEVKSLAAIGEAAAMVGHDLRNPLQATVGTLYLARELLASGEIDGTKKAMELLNSLDGQVYYMDKIVTDLQNYARPIGISRLETNLSELTKATISLLQIPRDVETATETEGELTRAMIDAELLKRVLVNLVLNAVQAMPNGGKLTITTCVTQDSVIVSVQDTGVGIAAENLNKIFKPFFTTKAQGQGLGLAVCKRLVEVQGGAISVQSQLGAGSTFTIKIPTPKPTTVRAEQSPIAAS